VSAFDAVIGGIWLTIILTVVSFAIGVVAGIPLVLARRSSIRTLRMASTFAIDMIRGVPPIVWLFFIYFGIGDQVRQLSTLEAALIGLGVISAAYMAEIYRGGFAAIPNQQWDAGRALGLHPVYSLGFIIAPQVIRTALPAAASYAIGLLKDSSIASTIGVNEILYRASNYAETTEHANVYLIAGLIYIVLSIPLALVSRRVDKRLRARLGA